MSPSFASRPLTLAFLGSSLLALGCSGAAPDELDVELRSATDGWGPDVGGGGYTDTGAGDGYTESGSPSDLGTGGYGDTGGYTDGGSDDTGGATDGGSATSGVTDGTTCAGGTPCVPKKLDEASKLIPDNDQAGAGAVGCPTASMRHQIDGPEAGMSCEGPDCKFTYTLEIRATMTAAMLQAWNTQYSPPGPDGNPATSDCPGYNAFTHAFLNAFVGWTGNGQASAEVDGNDMTCNFDAASVTLSCTYEIDISCNGDSECTGGKADPYDVEVWVQPNGQHRRTFETTFQAQVTDDDDCECTMGSVTGDVADAFDYTTTLLNGNQLEWDPATGQWKPVP